MQEKINSYSEKLTATEIEMFIWKKKKLVETVGDLTIPHFFLLNCYFKPYNVSSRSTDKFRDLLLFKTMHMNQCFVNWKLWVYLVIQTSEQCLLCQLSWWGPSKPKILFGEAWHFFKFKQSNFYEKLFSGKTKTFITSHNTKYTIECWTSQCHVGHLVEHHTDKFC